MRALVVALAATGVLALAFTVCLPWNGEDCPYTPDQGGERLSYNWGNTIGQELRKDYELLPDDASVFDNDIYAHRWGYRDGYWHGVLNAKFGKPNESTPWYPESEVYVRSYLAGLEDGHTKAMEERPGTERLAFAEGFGDGLLDGEGLCE